MKYEDQITICSIINQLISANLDDLLEECQKEDEYIQFLSSLRLLLKNDHLFFNYLPEVIEFLFTIINQKRFSFGTQGDIRNLENEIICKLNHIRSSLNQEDADFYHKMQQILRMTDYDNRKQVLTSMSYDMILLLKLEKDELDSTNPYLFLQSTSYLTSTFPEYYKKHPNYVTESINYLNKIKRGKSFQYKRQCHTLKSDLRKI